MKCGVHRSDSGSSESLGLDMRLITYGVLPQNLGEREVRTGVEARGLCQRNCREGNKKLAGFGPRSNKESFKRGGGGATSSVTE
jgi:hypothetical protein